MADHLKAEIQAELLARYEDFRSEVRKKLALGRLSEALEICDSAIEFARAHDAPELIDRAIVNRIGVSIEMGSTQSEIAELGKILLRASSQEVRFLAAYNLAWAYKGREEVERAISYASRALRVAETLGNAEWKASALNVLGLSHLSGSYFQEATTFFAEGLELLPDRRERRYAALLDNYGYCLVVQGLFREGFRALLESLRTLRRLGESWVETAPHISLSFAYLELGKARPAKRHGLSALRLAEEMGDSKSIKASLYLLGEAAKQEGDEFAARRFFQRLQESFYPKAPDLIDLLLVVDARTMVNLKA